MRDEMNVEPVDSELNRLADSIAALVNEAKKHLGQKTFGQVCECSDVGIILEYRQVYCGVRAGRKFKSKIWDSSTIISFKNITGKIRKGV